MVYRVLDGVKGELRGSDLLGLVGPGRIAALLVHTDVRGAASVFPRVRSRLVTLARTVGAPAVRLGRAVLSDDCKTASALLNYASRDAEAINAA